MDRVRLHPYGYGWVFRKGTRLSVGIGGLKDQLQHPRDLYAAYLEDEGLLAAIEYAEDKRRTRWDFGTQKPPSSG